MCLYLVHRVRCDDIAHIIVENMDTYSPERLEATLCVVIGCGAGSAGTLRQILADLPESSALYLPVFSHSKLPDLAESCAALAPSTRLPLRSVSTQVDGSQPGVFVLEPGTLCIVRQGELHPLSGVKSDNVLSPFTNYHVDVTLRRRCAPCPSPGDRGVMKP